MEELYKEECPHCRQEALSAFIESGYLNSISVLNEVARDIKAGDHTAARDKLFDLYNNNFQKGAREVFKPTSSNRRDLDYLYKFEANTAKFAAFKSQYVTEVLQKAFMDAPDEYDFNAKAILRTFNRFQVTEYNTNIARCRTARQFMKISKNEDLYPNLEWLRTRSADPRELHLSFVGLILPMNHPFFRENQPGNLYNCKCGLRQVNKPATLNREITNVPPARGLEGNPYTTREIFTEKHPYFQKVKKTPEIRQMIEKQVYRQFEELSAYKSGGKYFTHPLTDPSFSDYGDLVIISKQFAQNGNNAYIMPKLSSSKGDLYNYLYRNKGVLENKMPDLLIGNHFYEFESFTGDYSHRKLANMISRAAKQSDKIIIDVRGSTDTDWYIKRKIFANASIKEAWILKDGNRLYRLP